jgi:hypothetical protein
MNKLKLIGALALIGAVSTLSAGAIAKDRKTGRGNGPVVYVTSTGLVYDSIVLTDLPQKGPFQKLEMAGPTGLQTEWGPGDPDFVGGRWWLDKNLNGVMDPAGDGEDNDAYFLCPLLGPGRPAP